MKVRKVSNEGNERLIVIFAGWAMDYRPFASLRRDGYDIAVVWDYRPGDDGENSEAPGIWDFAFTYTEICVFAWSLGVTQAILPPALEAKVTRRIAINGSETPVDDLRGIPQAIFRGTLDGLTDRSLDKFYYRVCGSRKAFDNFCACKPERPLDELRDELASFIGMEPRHMRWDVALIARNDSIFPYENLVRVWENVPAVLSDGPHMPDFQKIIYEYTVNKQCVGERFCRRRQSYDEAAPVQHEMAGELLQLIEKHGLAEKMSAPGARTIELGSGTGFLSRHLDRICGNDATLELWDLAGPSPVPGRTFREGDAETGLWNEADASADVILSASTVQWFNSPSRFIGECMRILRPGGIILFSTFLPGNLAEVAQATGRSLPLPDAPDWHKYLPEGLEILAEQSGTHTLRFASPVEVFRHLRSTGVNSLGSGDENLRKALSSYPVGPDGSASATYRTYILMLRKI